MSFIGCYYENIGKEVFDSWVKGIWYVDSLLELCRIWYVSMCINLSNESVLINRDNNLGNVIVLIENKGFLVFRFFLYVYGKYVYEFLYFFYVD